MTAPVRTLIFWNTEGPAGPAGAPGPTGCLEQSAPCIDPVLGPAGGLVWSSTTWKQQPGRPFVIDFFAGEGSEVTTTQKDGPVANARAVRGGR